MIISLPLAALTLACAWAITSQAASPLPLGVSVPHAHRADATVTRALSSFRRWVWVSGAACALLCLAGPLAASLSSLVLTIAAGIAYAKFSGHIRDAKKEGRWYDGVETAVTGQISSIDDPRLSGLVVSPRMPWLWILGSVLAIVISVTTVRYHWNEIPPVIPTHWGANLQPDAWQDKSFSSVFAASLASTFMLLTMVGICWMTTSLGVHTRTDRSIKGLLRTNAVSATTTTGLGVLFFLIIAGLSFSQVTSVLPGYERLNNLAFIVILVLSIVGTIALIIMISMATLQVDEAIGALDNGATETTAAKQATESPDTDAHYKWGIFYYNPADPALLVDKRLGAGYTFNMARWQAQVFMGLIFLLILAAMVAPLFQG